MSTSQRRPKRFLTAEQKYDLWVRMLTGQLTQGDAAAEAGVERSTITRLRAEARYGAIAGLQVSKRHCCIDRSAAADPRRCRSVRADCLPPLH
jgi:hypothetical protein